MAVLDPARVDFSRKLLMPHLTGLSRIYCLMAVLGGNHGLVKAELLAGAVVAVKEREHSV